MKYALLNFPSLDGDCYPLIVSILLLMLKKEYPRPMASSAKNTVCRTRLAQHLAFSVMALAAPFSKPGAIQ